MQPAVCRGNRVFLKDPEVVLSRYTEEVLEKKTAGILISPFRLDKGIDPRLLVAADVLKRRAECGGGPSRSFDVKLVINHGGLRAFRRMSSAQRPQNKLLQQKDALQRDFQDFADKLTLSFASPPVFFFDKKYWSTVSEVFLALYEQDRLHRRRVVMPWCPRCGTFLDRDRRRSTEKETVRQQEILIEVKGGDTRLPVVFTDTELLGAVVGLAIHPDDKTYGPFTGRTAVLPLYRRQIRIIATEHETEVGVIRPVLPAYNQHDYDIAQEAHLSVIDIFDGEGKTNARAGRYAELSREEARDKILSALDELESLGETTEAVVEKSCCEICGGTLFHRIAYQWFVDLQVSPEEGTDAAGKEQATIVPKSFQSRVAEEAEGRSQWCISRQSCWGRSLPVWFCSSCDHYVVSDQRPESCSDCGCESFIPSSDKLASGFLSALWPLAAESWDREYREKEKDEIVFADTMLFGTHESELVYLTCSLLNTVAPEAVPSFIVGVKESTERGGLLSADYDPDTLRLAVLAEGPFEETCRQSSMLLGGVETFFNQSVASGCGGPVESDSLPLLERWLCHCFLRTAELSHRNLDVKRVGSFGTLLMRGALTPFVQDYIPRAGQRPSEYLAAVEAMFCTYVIPFLSLLIPETARRWYRTVTGRRLEAPAFPCEAGEAAGYDAVLLNRVQQMFEIERSLERRHALDDAMVLKGPDAEEAAFRELSEVFRCTQSQAALGHEFSTSQPYHGTLFGTMILLEPSEESNLEEVIKSLRTRSRIKKKQKKLQRDEDRLAEFINELRGR